MHQADLDALQVGEKVLVDGPTDSAGVLSASIIVVIPNDSGANARGNGKVVRQMVYGVVSTLTPAMTLTVPNGKILNIATRPNTRVIAPEDGALADIELNDEVEVMGDPTGNSTFTAILVRKLAFTQKRAKK